MLLTYFLKHAMTGYAFQGHSAGKNIFCVNFTLYIHLSTLFNVPFISFILPREPSYITHNAYKSEISLLMNVP